MNKLLFVALTTLLFACCLLPVTLAVAQAPIMPPGTCGNGIAEEGEACDPGSPAAGIEPDLGGATCEGQGFTGGGEIVCMSKCTLDISACYCDAGTSFPATGQTTSWHAGDDGDVRAGAPLSYTDNGDGTITDDNTGLMWEKKDDSGGIHDKNATYTWSNSLSSISVFIDQLNNTCEGDGLDWCDSDDFCGAGGRCGFAGYRDWRMPNIKELQSIVNYQLRYPSVAPAFDTNCVSGCTVQQCSCTGSSTYWSSSSHADDTYYAWGVNFKAGHVHTYPKSFDNYVRALRGGL